MLAKLTFSLIDNNVTNSGSNETKTEPNHNYIKYHRCLDGRAWRTVDSSLVLMTFQSKLESRHQRGFRKAQSSRWVLPAAEDGFAQSDLAVWWWWSMVTTGYQHSSSGAFQFSLLSACISYSREVWLGGSDRSQCKSAFYRILLTPPRWLWRGKCIAFHLWLENIFRKLLRKIRLILNNFQFLRGLNHWKYFWTQQWARFHIFLSKNTSRESLHT